MINFSVTFKSGIPIYEQVIYAVKKAIIEGYLRQGDKFPSVREMSKELRINPNTAQKIVANLVKEKILEVRPGIGSIVSAKPAASEDQKQDLLQQELERLVIEAKSLSIKKKDFMEAINQHWAGEKEEKKK